MEEVFKSLISLKAKQSLCLFLFIYLAVLGIVAAHKLLLVAFGIEFLDQGSNPGPLH